MRIEEFGSIRRIFGKYYLLENFNLARILMKNFICNPFHEFWIQNKILNPFLKKVFENATRCQQEPGFSRGFLSFSADFLYIARFARVFFSLCSLRSRINFMLASLALYFINFIARFARVVKSLCSLRSRS